MRRAGYETTQVVSLLGGAFGASESPAAAVGDACAVSDSVCDPTNIESTLRMAIAESELRSGAYFDSNTSDAVAPAVAWLCVDATCRICRTGAATANGVRVGATGCGANAITVGGTGYAAVEAGWGMGTAYALFDADWVGSYAGDSALNGAAGVGATPLPPIERSGGLPAADNDCLRAGDSTGKWCTAE